VFANNLLRLVTLNALRSSIPADDIAFGAEKKNSIILYVRDQGIEMLFGSPQGIVARQNLFGRSLLNHITIKWPLSVDN
jgi:hypothetical protein